MKQKENIFYDSTGNALVYVLIAIALFAALGFTVSRQTHNTGTDEIDDAKAEILALELLTYSAQVKSILDQIIITGTDMDDLDFTQPSEAGFNTAPHIDKVYHPQGGGLTPANLPEKAIYQISGSPPAGWYLGRFNNVEWTKTAGNDVILTAYQISRTVCEKVNEKITGTKTIPALTNNLSNFLLDTGINTDLAVASCAACEGYSMLCVSNSGVNAFAFYSIVADQ